MRMFFSGYFWGLVLVIWGVLLILNTTFHFKIPIGSIIIASILILLGIQLLVGPKMYYGIKNDHEVIFNEAKIKATSENDKYSVVFGSGVFDFTDINKTDKKQFVKADVVFGQAIVKIKKTDPIIIKGNCVFGNIKFPDSGSLSFGDRTYTTSSYAGSSNPIEIKADVVFGEMVIQEVD